ncbi:MAG: helix-turn-helix domain-containing protein [Cyclobacteriaceae bacterium]|jgi:hypothetical protein|nr:helix-turn-helix domain-containing protein [Cyclobacteriaceae bacterium]
MESHLSQLIRFINTTASPIFLTGKAGTGKTTFLKNLGLYTHKNFIVVAPTGIAALNAGGVTIHSQFLLPPMTFVPERSVSIADPGRVVDQQTLARKHPLNSARKQVLRAIDLLVIDEVSMLRADLLDAIDYRLKAARGNFREPFGGVQVLFIGDLYQLPPIIARGEESLMRQYYQTGWFYEAHALRNEPPVYYELTKIYRQHDADFITLLNHLRNNTVTPEDIDRLNQQYQPAVDNDILPGVITLTTHNYKADEINQRELRKLSSPAHFFEARIEGEFPESMYPVQVRIELKEGAQIMFTRNDTDEAKAYVNGQLATVMKIGSGEIEVQMAGSGERYTLTRERWENKRYINHVASHVLEEEVIGTFEHYPIKLAWAITVHKSQGLTFDRALLDVGQAFAPGQVYVALSRLRTLQGLILRSRIPASAISTDAQVAAFALEHHRPERLPAVMKEKQQQFIQGLVDRTFDFAPLEKEISYVKKDEPDFLDDTLKPVLTQLAERLASERTNTQTFTRQLHDLLRTDTPKLFERLSRGREYYLAFLWDTQALLLHHLETVKQQKRVKTYLNQLTELDQQLTRKITEVDRLHEVVASILEDRETMDVKSRDQARVEKREALLASLRNTLPTTARVKASKRKTAKKPTEDSRSTYDVTLDLLKAGKTIAEIAAERSLTVGTIEGHLAKAIEAGRLDVYALVNEEEQTEIKNAINTLPDAFTSKQLYEALAGKYGYGKLKAMMAWVTRDKGTA